MNSPSEIFSGSASWPAWLEDTENEEKFLEGFVNNISIEIPDTMMSRRELSHNNNNNNRVNFNQVSSLPSNPP